jgi:hypothetical protein
MVNLDVSHHKAQPHDRIVPIGIFGRFEQSGHVSDVSLTLDEIREPELPFRSNNLGTFLEQASKFLAKSKSAARPIAFVGIGIGPARLGHEDQAWWKGIFIEEDHPRAPEGTPEGGEFVPKDEAVESTAAEASSDAQQLRLQIPKELGRRVASRILRRQIRTIFITALRVMAGVAADAIPFVGEAFDAAQIAAAVSDFDELANVTSAAAKFVKKGPQTLEDLRVSPQDEGFATSDAFIKLLLDKRWGPAGQGLDYHHVVEQGGANAIKIPAEELHSTENMIPMPRLLHEAISAEYGRAATKYVDPTLVKQPYVSLRTWLQTQPYDVQRAVGIKVMKNLGILKQ